MTAVKQHTSVSKVMRTNNVIYAWISLLICVCVCVLETCSGSLHVLATCDW
jgi:hypothetical protein